MNDFANRIANLSPEARALFEAKLREKPGAKQFTIPTLLRSGEPQAFPLSFAQQRLWFLYLWGPHSAFYNINSALKIEGELEADALERCVNQIVKRHESLRTSFTAVDGGPLQIIHPDAEIEILTTDLRGFSRLDAEVRRIAAEEIRRPFDLSRAPLIRVSLLRLGNTSHVLLTTLHHIVSDVGRSGSSTANSQPCIALSWVPSRFRFPSYLSNIGTTPSGNAAICPAKSSSRSSRTGRNNSRMRRRCWNCRPTGRVPRYKASRARA